MNFFKRYAFFSLSRICLIGLSGVVGSSFLGGYLITIQYKGNVHTIIDREAYRSNQPDPLRIAQLQSLYGIRTIINLRGAEPGSKWYDDEVATSNVLGIQHADYEMSSSRQLTSEQTRALIALMQKAEKPILIHCKAGSDRTGLAAALYVAAVAKRGERRAEGQMSISYGHFGLPFSPTHAMEDTFEAIEAELGFSSS
ncbi:tyrosine-protein phosphatase [Brucella thiophenivorans]|uniref:Protein-tyrosine phosphatase family protein n=1 Tax=Brucella thiophenivorans TaxID=571255 RepID=A0A256FYH9_9HYPH|nr:tyrosine-protein phosphatase [Brucella thiophenivorans]OYR19836.1 protein-tyrosine phosphatase family protein [Brucella thiophenivorans]